MSEDRASPRKQSVSVALATHNGARFLEEQLASLAAQSRPPDELVACDDRSSDTTVAVLEAFAERAPFPVRIVRNDEQLGPGRNFAKAALSTTSEIVFFCDQDDVWHGNKIETVLDRFNASDRPLLVTHDAAIVTEDGAPTGLSLAGQAEATGALAEPCIVAGCCMAFDRRLAALFDAMAPQVEWHDAWIEAIASRLGTRRHIAERLIDYRRHASNQSASFISRTRRSGRFHRYLERWQAMRAGETDKRLRQAGAFVESALAALRAHREGLVGALAEPAFDSAIADFMGERDRIERRIELRSAGAKRRLGLIRRNWRLGDYRGGNRLLSLARDVLA